ncbi:hypothetical protein Q650_00409, partial [Bartonella quintana JK 73rel]
AEDDDDYVCGLDQVSGFNVLDINPVEESLEKEGISLTIKREDSALKGLRALSGVFGVQSIRSGSHPYASGYEAAIFDLGETKKFAGQLYNYLDTSSTETSIGEGATASEGGLAIGKDAMAGVNSVALGAEARAEAPESVALGFGSQTRPRKHARGWDPRINGSNSNDNNPWWMSSWGEVSIGNVNAGKTRQLTGVAAGWKDTDAVNVAQLKALKKWAEESFSGEEITYDEGSKVIRIGSKRSGDKIDIKNSDGQDRVLAGVKDGEVSKGSVDAINGSQLWKTNQTVAGLNVTLNDLGKNLTNYLGGG